MAIGYEFEGAFFEGLRKAGVEVESSSISMDLYAGTDFVYQKEINVDVTHNYNGKDHMVPSIHHCVSMGDYELNVGIRTGNSHVKFKEPVVVVGIDADSHYVHDWIIPNLVSRIGKNIKNILETIEDTYYEYVDSVA